MDRVEKNDIVVVDILDMNQDGEGVGKVNGYPLFIKDTVIGDKAEVKVIKALKSFGYGRLMRIIEPSSDRIQPRCAVAQGGPAAPGAASADRDAGEARAYPYHVCLRGALSHFYFPAR